jgi:hypothetical protein
MRKLSGVRLASLAAGSGTALCADARVAALAGADAAAGTAARGTAAGAAPPLPGISGDGVAAPLMATRPADNSAGLLFKRRPAFVLSCYLPFVL